MNKSELIDQIAKSADISKAAAGRALDATTSAITNAMKKGDLVTLIGFGTFHVGKRPFKLALQTHLNSELVKHLKML